MEKVAKAPVEPIRQRTQYSCMATSMTMCLRALGHDCNEDEVNRVMGARPMQGASWENALACAQHYGCRATLTTPATVEQLKAWTDQGIPIMIAWNPEGRDWSHASVVFDVDDDGNVWVADPNIPDPSETVRVVSRAEFYKKWFEKWPNYLVRRPACAIEREITPDGRQVNILAGEAAAPTAVKLLASRTASTAADNWDWKPWAKKVLDWLEANLGERGTVSVRTRQRHGGGLMYSVSFIYPVGRAGEYVFRKWTQDNKLGRRWVSFTQRWVKDGLTPVVRNGTQEFYLPDGTFVEVMGVGFSVTPGEKLGATAARRVAAMYVGRANRKNKPKSMRDRMKIDKTPPKPRNPVQQGLIERKPGGGTHHTRDYDVTKGRGRPKHKPDYQREAGYKGNPDGVDIYPNEIDHGYGEPLGGGTDVMRRLQNKLIHEQGDVVPQRPESPKVARYTFDSAGLGEAARRVAALWLTQQETN